MAQVCVCIVCWNSWWLNARAWECPCNMRSTMKDFQQHCCTTLACMQPKQVYRPIASTVCRNSQRRDAFRVVPATNRGCRHKQCYAHIPPYLSH
jgi:hypothetical protein